MWCVLVSDATEMASGVAVIGSYRLEAKASAVADQINRKIEIHSPARSEEWGADGDGEPHAWVHEMRTKVTEVYDDLAIRSLR